MAKFSDCMYGDVDADGQVTSVTLTERGMALLAQCIQPTAEDAILLPGGRGTIPYSEYKKLLQKLQSLAWEQIDPDKYICAYGGLKFIIDESKDTNCLSVYTDHKYLGRIDEQVVADTVLLDWWVPYSVKPKAVTAAILAAFPSVTLTSSKSGGNQAEEESRSNSSQLTVELQNCGNSAKDVAAWCEKYAQKHKYDGCNVTGKFARIGIPKQAYNELDSAIRTIVDKSQ
jgi:hypothetical protein